MEVDIGWNSQALMFLSISVLSVDLFCLDHLKAFLWMQVSPTCRQHTDPWFQFWFSLDIQTLNVHLPAEDRQPQWHCPKQNSPSFPSACSSFVFLVLMNEFALHLVTLGGELGVAETPPPPSHTYILTAAKFCGFHVAILSFYSLLLPSCFWPSLYLTWTSGTNEIPISELVKIDFNKFKFWSFPDLES